MGDEKEENVMLVETMGTCMRLMARAKQRKEKRKGGETGREGIWGPKDMYVAPNRALLIAVDNTWECKGNFHLYCYKPLSPHPIAPLPKLLLKKWAVWLFSTRKSSDAF